MSMSVHAGLTPMKGVQTLKVQPASGAVLALDWK